ncbi:hypothetical protein Poli38472_013789 [Pythium oligandrum]|uniref:Transmembrane protein n=1 Tax=Pythium oligandrum TaxID=41045 RepID=A0A8K1C233_PYTOL|nr:hypothetical protein Poli38472_013789 [Pythium oligandrum]|eukprot:TMW55027.1 hypothetical protein Poli38472_013789 [Pythium oligandrum]
MTDRGKKSWSFISEESFSGRSDNPLNLVDFETLDNNLDHDPDQMDLAADMLRFQERMQQQPTLPKPAVTTREPRSASTPNTRRKMTVTFKDDRDSIPVVVRRSSAPSPSIQLLEEPLYRTRQRSNTPQNFFNHALYSSLRTGDTVEPFSKDYLGLIFTGAASGFMVPFLAECFHPLLSVYLNFNGDQVHATERFLVLPGVISFFIGMLSDFYPLWHLHRKAYIVGGWVFAYLNLMALVVITMIDDGTDLRGNNVRTFYGGIVYVLLMMGTSLGVTIASVTTTAFLVELSQREAIHERGTVMMKYLITRRVAMVASAVVTVASMDFDEATGRTRSVISMKVMVLMMAFVSLVPIPAVLFWLTEEKREIKVDSVDRSSLSHQLWNILQQQAVWRIILFICATFFLVYFQFDNATLAVKFWANATPDAVREGEIPKEAIALAVLIFYRLYLLNYSWVRLNIVALVLFVVTSLVSGLPVVFNGARSPWYYVPVESMDGVFEGVLTIISTLPLIEIAETGIEGATTGLVASYDVLIRSVVATFSDAIGKSSTSLVHDFSPEMLQMDKSGTRWQVAGFILGNAAINLLAILPILYLLPHQKLDAQQMRTYGGYNQSAGIAIATLFVLLVIYAATMNILALVHKY